MIHTNDWERLLMEEELKLMREMESTKGMSWNKFFKMIRLNALLRANQRP